MMATDTPIGATMAPVTRFESVLESRDVDASMADMPDDCVAEHVAPAATRFGRHEGAEAVRAVWESMDDHFPGFTQDIVDIFATGDRACCRYVIRWKGPDGGEAALHGGGEAALHGVDVITVRDGKIAEKLTYGTL